MKKCKRKTLCASTTEHCTGKRPALQVTYTRKRPQISFRPQIELYFESADDTFCFDIL